jgi:hypothetical protein
MLLFCSAQPHRPDNTIRVLDACAGFSLDQLRHEYPDGELAHKAGTLPACAERHP